MFGFFIIYTGRICIACMLGLDNLVLLDILHQVLHCFPLLIFCLGFYFDSFLYSACMRKG